VADVVGLQPTVLGPPTVIRASAKYRSVWFTGL
jgi:hypothetical protein